MARVKTWVAFGSESHQRSVKSSVCDVHMAPRGEASHEGGKLSTSRFAGSIEISLNDNSLETEEDVTAIAAQLAAAGFDEIEHSSGVAIPRPSEDCTEPSWLIEAERILFETSAFASNLEGSAFERADAPINPPDLRQKSEISFFKVQGVNKRFMIGLLRRTMRQSTGAQGPSTSRAETS